MRDSIRYILTIAEAERTLLYRKAKFWVLAGVGACMVILFLVVMTIASIVDNNFPGEFLLEGTDAYLALYFFSYIQAVLIIFVAGDFRQAEEKARLDQVMLAKPMTTANWVLGKYLGVVSGLLYLNLFLLLLATVGRVVKVLATGAGFNVLPFLAYFGVATVPSILFMTALMFLLVSVLRSQAVAMIVALGYVASIWFYFQHKFNGLIDYGAFFAPLFWSDFIGFGDIDAVLWQRLFFVLLGLALLGVAILLYPRLWQSSVSKRLSMVSAVLSCLLAVAVALNLIRDARQEQDRRATDIAYQTKRAGEPLCIVQHYDLRVRHGLGDAPLSVSATLVVSNPNLGPLTQLVFALNAGLQVTEAKWSDGSAIPFQHRHHLLTLNLQDRTLSANGVDSLHLTYSGSIDADGFMLSRLPESKGLIRKDDGPWVQGDMSAWLRKDFAVLPAQCGWYPTPGPATGYDFEAPRPGNFATATIRVETDAALQAVAQGTPMTEAAEGARQTTVFRVEKPLPGFSLNIGEYKRLAHRFRHVQIELYVHPNHLLDYELFADVADTCYEAVESMLDVLERVTGTKYPYERLAIVEVPLQMQIYTGHYGVNNVLQQPGVVMLDEVTIASQRFKKEFDRETKNARRRGRDDSPARIKRDVFVETLVDVFLYDRFWGADGSFRAPIRNYVNFQLDIRNPILDRALELQFYEAAEREIRDLFYPDRWNAALSSYDRMRQNEWGSWTVRRRYGIEIDSLFATLTRTPLSEMRPQGDGNLYRACVDFKAPPILQMLSQAAGEQNYLRAMSELVDSYPGMPVHRSHFLATVQQFSDAEVTDFFAAWFDQATFPGYQLTYARARKFDTGKMNIQYEVTARVQNGEKGEGFVRLICETENDKIRRSVRLGSYEEKEVCISVAEEPKKIKVVPYFSRNRGVIMKEVSIDNRIRRGVPRDTMFTVATTSDSSFFVVDDQDDGFFTPVSSEAKYLRPPLHGSSWWEATNSFAFGKYYFGWRVKRAGSGDAPARWQTTVPQDGEYELSFYYRADRSWYGRRASRSFQIEVTTAEGVVPVEIKPRATPDGWYPLGRFRFETEEPAVVELQDVGNGYVIADAIRWEYIE